MKIGYDAKRLFNNFTGLGNYSRFIVEAVSRYFPENQYTLYTPRSQDHPDTRFFSSAGNIHTVTPPLWIKKSSLGSIWRSFLIGQHIRKEPIDVYHGLSHELPRFLPQAVKKVVSVHDLIFFRYPEFYHKIDVAIYKAKLRHACLAADIIIAISEQTKADILNYLNINPDKIVVIYQGCHANFRRLLSPEQIDSIAQRYALPKKYILNVGSIEPRKNVLLLLKALKILQKESDLHVVIVGKKTSYLQVLITYIKENQLERRVHFLHHVSFDDLPGIYQGASIFVYPSFFEGFGIPIIEAIHSGVPVISSKGSCFAEAAGPDGIFVDPNMEEELAAQIIRIMSATKIRKQMIQQSLSYVTRFLPEKIASDLNKVYTS